MTDKLDQAKKEVDEARRKVQDHQLDGGELFSELDRTTRRYLLLSEKEQENATLTPLWDVNGYKEARKITGRSDAWIEARKVGGRIYHKKPAGVHLFCSRNLKEQSHLKIAS